MAATIILIGFMGCGKTTVGKLIAHRLRRPFYDADQVLVEKTGVSIADIFARQGEPYFRRVEEETVNQLLDRVASEAAVIALGGGAVTTRALFERLTIEPLVVFLDQDVETAFARARDGSRPLASDWPSFVELFNRREHLYRGAAKFIIGTKGKSAEIIADEIIELLNIEASQT